MSDNKNTIVIYGKKVCSYCDQVKTSLDNLGLDYCYVDIEINEYAKNFIVSQGFKTVPQLYYNNKHYGGSEGLVDLVDDWEDTHDT